MKQLRITKQLIYCKSIMITSATINRYNEGVNRTENKEYSSNTQDKIQR